MKKYYLPLLCVGLLSSALFSQDTYITGNVVVKVQPNTLFYHGGDFVVTSAVTNQSVITNDGNIEIKGNFDNSNVLEPAAGSNGANFVNRFLSENVYGQVIIHDESTSQGMLTMEKESINPSVYEWGQFAIPYKFDNIKQAFETLFPSLTYKEGSRYKHSVMTWDNKTRPEYDHLAANSAFNPFDYVLLNLEKDADLIDYMDGGGIIVPYAGTPANNVHQARFYPSMYPSVDVPWSVWKNHRNYYSEQYKTYLEEHVRDVSVDDQHFARYYFQFGNPYTSNIDLSYIGTNDGGTDDGVFIENLESVVKITGAGWNENTGLEYSVAVRAVWDGVQWGGNSNALLIRPFEAFYIGLVSDQSTDRGVRVFNFNDGVKTFNMVPSNPGEATPSGRFFTGLSAFGNDEYSAQDRLGDNGDLKNMYTLGSGSFYQLGLSLYTEDGVKTGNEVYVIVDGKTKVGINQKLESEYPDFKNGFFLVQENPDGSEISTPTRKMQINAISPKYISRPIQLFFKKDNQSLNGYYLKAELFYKNIFQKLGVDEGNFADGNSFFFYDKAQKLLLPITTDFSYYIERPEEDLNSRYVIYWNGGPESTSLARMDTEELEAGTTRVYKDGDLHKIRFNDSWKSADIFVYDMTGRIIHQDKEVKTDVDYVLNLPKTSVYVVKMQSETGETVTQKIIK